MVAVCRPWCRQWVWQRQCRLPALHHHTPALHFAASCGLISRESVQFKWCGLIIQTALFGPALQFLTCTFQSLKIWSRFQRQLDGPCPAGRGCRVARGCVARAFRWWCLCCHAGSDAEPARRLYLCPGPSHPRALAQVEAGVAWRMIK